MLFNSYTFLVFFAAVLALHHAPLSWKVKKLNLLGASYLFYAAWNPPFVILLWISTVTDWLVAGRIHRATTTFTRRAWLLVSLGVNLGMLGFFKYGTFLLENFTAGLALANIQFQPLAADIILPVGISFYTFQTLSYTLDIYRGRTRPWYSFLDYALYVTFFPQLVAGPIVRAREFLPQCAVPARATSQQLGWGLSLLLLGMFQKVVLADAVLAPVVEAVYDSTRHPGPLVAWSATLAFAGQIFCDFAGYSTCAIGVALCLGFRLPDNFRFPYGAIGCSDFWRRWHISLSSWLKDYLYIPLGGNRNGGARTHVNLMVTMLLGGLWHGASWTFVVWGGLHGFYLVAERFLKRVLGKASLWRLPTVRALLALLTFSLVAFAWVFFRSGSFDEAFSLAATMLGAGSHSPTLDLPTNQLLLTWATIGLILLFHSMMRDVSLEAVAQRCPWWLRSLFLATMLVAIVTMSGEDRAFLYFQF